MHFLQGLLTRYPISKSYLYLKLLGVIFFTIRQKQSRLPITGFTIKQASKFFIPLFKNTFRKTQGWYRRL